MHKLVAVVVLAAALVSIFGPGAFRGRAELPFGRPEPQLVDIKPGPLGVDDFWMLVDHSALAASADAQLDDLRTSLRRLTPEQIVDFEKLFTRVLRESYSWNLWGAAYVANGGASDDGFEYFRCWLISRGRKVFEAVKADPDALAAVANDGSGELEFERFAYAASEVWAEKTGRDPNAMPLGPRAAFSDKPSGVPFDENAGELARRYPKLWKRFGNR